MKTYLFPYYVKSWAWIIFGIGLFCGLIVVAFDPEPEFLDFKVFSLYNSDNLFVEQEGFFKWTKQNIFNDLSGILIILGVTLIGFSKEKIEDEFIMQLRLNSLAIAVYINYSILLLAFLLVHGFDFINIMVYNMFTLLLIFILVFQIKLKTSNNGR